MNINEKIRKYREDNKISIAELSELLGGDFSAAKLSRIETGKQQLSDDEKDKIWDVLNLGMSEMNRAEYDHLRNAFIEIKKHGLEITKDNFAGNRYVSILTKDIPRLLIEECNIDTSEYLIVGSYGKGSPSEIPWVSIFDRRLTETATKGFYVVILFTKDLKSFYVSLNQGYTLMRNLVGAKQAKINIKKVSKFLRKELGTSHKKKHLLEEIDLQALNPLGRGYESGNILARKFDIDSLDIKILINTIREFIAMNDEIVGKIGERSIEEYYDYILAQENEDMLIFENDAEDSSGEDIDYGGNEADEDVNYTGKPKKKEDPLVNNKGQKVYKRSRTVAKNALKLAEYKCEYDPTNKGFIRKSDGKIYRESHHLIPISKTDLFEYSLDIEENIVCINETAHRILHYGVLEDKLPILKKLYEKRKDMLESVGLYITFDDLINLYK